MSFKDFPFVYEMKGGLGGSLYIFLSKGLFAMRCHLLIRTFLRLGTEGRYSVTNGNILLRDLFYLFKADILSSYFTSERVASAIRLFGKPLTHSLWLNSFIFSSNVLFDELVLRGLRASPLVNPFLRPLNPWRVARRKMRVHHALESVESFCQFEVRAHIKDRFALKSVALVYTCIQESDFCC